MILYLFLFILPFCSFAKDEFFISQVDVDCHGSDFCKQREKKYKAMTGEYRSLIHFKDSLKVMASDGGYQTFSYFIEKMNDQNILKIRLKLKPIITSIKIAYDYQDLDFDPLQFLNFREGDFFEPQKLEESEPNLKARLDEMGFPQNSHSFEFNEKNGEVSISLKIKLGPPRVFKRIKTDTSSSFIRKFIHRKFLPFYNRPFDLNNFKIHMDEIQKELFSYGYFLANLDFVPVYKKNRVILEIKSTNDQLFAFDLRNLQKEHRDVIHNLLVDLFRKYKRPLTETTIQNALKEHYQNKAMLKARFLIQISQHWNNSNEIVELYRIDFEENSKTRFFNVSFKGNNYFSNKKIRKIFHREAFELASAGFYDKEYFNYFQEFLRNKYIENGFVQVRVFDPIYIFSNQNQTTKLEYSIQEGQRAFVSKISFEGVSEELEQKILSEIKLKVSKPFNPLQVTSDIKIMTDFLQKQGYYYAEVINASDNEMVRYNKSGNAASVFFKVDTGPVIRFNRIIYLGNDKTRDRVISKKVFLKKGELVTPAKIQEIESAISATGLFNSVSVTPLKHHSKNAATDLLIKVSERDYGLVEIAPGYRTDLGLKLTGTITYQNIGGYNRSVSLKSQLNRRTSFTTIDPERANRVEHIIEHNTSVTYNQDDIFDTLIDGAASAAYQTQRFYAFDANILRLNGTLTRDLTKVFTSSVRYQYEDITQYEATEEINNGSFQIGSLTPGLTLDLRNNQVNATKGAFFNLSCEFANPYLLSQKQSDLTINYYKLISRNRFYIPFKNGTVAVSLVGGIQENLANQKINSNGSESIEGYIPTIKVFRLTGMDIIRGFTDEEMNRLPSGQDISDFRVDNKAYLANFKLEPRYFLNDSLMAGVFYDAGRVFVNQMDFGELRDSVGLTFKVVTPVGTLDFDYGIKLLRKKDANGRLEDPGRFHVSIGFF
jgi:outer membrane protein insertion porin family